MPEGIGATAEHGIAHPPQRVPQRGAVHIARDAQDVRRCSQIDPELGHRPRALEGRAGDAFSKPPAPEIFSLQAACGDVMVHTHRRNVASAQTCGARPHQQLGHLLAHDERTGAAAQVGAKPADPIEQRASRRHVRAERHLPRLVVVEGLSAVILDGDCSPQIAAGEIQPLGRVGLPDRRNRAADIVDACVRRVEQRRARSLQPALIHADVIVRHGDDLALRGADAGVQRVGSTLRRFVQITQWDREAGGVTLHDAAGVVGRVVVNDQHVPSSLRAYGAVPQIVQRLVQQRGAIVGRNEHGGVEATGAHTVSSRLTVRSTVAGTLSP